MWLDYVKLTKLSYHTYFILILQLHYTYALHMYSVNPNCNYIISLLF